MTDDTTNDTGRTDAETAERNANTARARAAYAAIAAEIMARKAQDTSAEALAAQAGVTDAAQSGFVYIPASKYTGTNPDAELVALPGSKTRPLGWTTSDESDLYRFQNVETYTSGTATPYVAKERKGYANPEMLDAMLNAAAPDAPEGEDGDAERFIALTEQFLSGILVLPIASRQKGAAAAPERTDATGVAAILAAKALADQVRATKAPKPATVAAPVPAPKATPKATPKA